MNLPTPISSLRAAGCLQLRFHRRLEAARTLLVTERQTVPLKVIRAFPYGNAGALVHLHNTSGGVLSSDQLTTGLHLEAGSRVALTTTSATRVYRQRGEGAAALLATTGELASGARLEMLPDPTILYNGASLRQTSTWHLRGNAGLLFWDILATGRSGYEEMLGFASYTNHVSVYIDSVPIALERYRLEPGLSALRQTLRLRDQTHVGTFYMVDGGTPAATWARLEREVHSLLAEAAPADVPAFWGVSTLVSAGLVVRFLDDTGGRMQAACVRLRQLFLRELWQEQEPMPRKIY